MAQRILCLSGWGQPYNALASLWPQATHFNYASYSDVAEALAACAKAASQHDIIIGWSLGGQLAVRIMAAHMALPQRLVLIATPFQFVANNQLPLGMKRDQYEKFCANYARNPERTLTKAWELITKGDIYGDTVRGYMNEFNKAEAASKNWLGWLRHLDEFSCADLSFGGFPSTLLVHGENDVVIEAVQSQRLAREIPNAKLVQWPDCGHAPHWHNAQHMRRLVEEHTHV